MLQLSYREPTIYLYRPTNCPVMSLILKPKDQAPRKYAKLGIYRPIHYSHIILRTH